MTTPDDPLRALRRMADYKSPKVPKTPQTETSTPAFLGVEEAFHGAMDALVAAGLHEPEAGPTLVALARGGTLETAGLPPAVTARPEVAAALSALIAAAIRLARPA